jgi:hypothetical protein
MSSLVGFDQKGAFGPAITLIYNAQYYNPKGVLELANLLKENFMKLAGVKPKGKKEFCAFIFEKNQSQTLITPAEVIGTKFFQNMQKANYSPIYHEKVLGFIVPRMLKTVQEQIPQANCESGQAQELNEWTAKFVESYMTEEQINKYCEIQNKVSEKIMKERKNIGEEVYKAATSKQFTEKDLDLLVEMNRVALERLQKADHFASTLNFTGKYLALFSMNEENPCVLGEDVLGLLSTAFKEKMFPK